MAGMRAMPSSPARAASWTKSCASILTLSETAPQLLEQFPGLLAEAALQFLGEKLQGDVLLQVLEGGAQVVLDLFVQKAHETSWEDRA